MTNTDIIIDRYRYQVHQLGNGIYHETSRGNTSYDRDTVQRFARADYSHQDLNIPCYWANFFVPSRSRRWSLVHFLRPLLKADVF